MYTHIHKGVGSCSALGGTVHYQDQSWGNLVTCNLSYVIFITFQVKSNITKLLFSQVICNLIILLSEVILLFVYSSCLKVLFS